MLSKPQTTLGLTFWESREVAEGNRMLRREFLERMTAVADVEIEVVEHYELTFVKLGELVRSSAT